MKAAGVALRQSTLTWQYFVSHRQAEAALQARTLAFELTGDKNDVWLDVHMHDKSEAGMEPGVRSSATFVAILTPSYFDSPYCLKELAWALDAGKQVRWGCEGMN